MGRTWRAARPGAREAIAGLIAALAILLQGVIPAAAIAHDHAGSGRIGICTRGGLKLVPLGADHAHHGFGGLACEQCVMASFAATAAATPALPILYAAFAPPSPDARPEIAHRTQAPPRPPSRAPPLHA